MLPVLVHASGGAVAGKGTADAKPDVLKILEFILAQVKLLELLAVQEVSQAADAVY